MTQRIQIRGDNQLLQTFADINAFDAWATPPMERATKKLYERVRTYPAPKPSYQRTFTLQRSIDWSVDSSPNGVTAHVFSHGANQGYGDYEWRVKVDGLQEWMHVDHWQTDKQDLEAEEPNFMNELSKATAEVLR